MPLRHCPASVRNLFSRLHWSRDRSILRSWMVGSLINDLFGTSTIWFCHRVRQRCWMVSASSGRLDHIGCLDFNRGRGGGGGGGWKSISVSRGSSGLSCTENYLLVQACTEHTHTHTINVICKYNASAKERCCKFDMVATKNKYLHYSNYHKHLSCMKIYVIKCTGGLKSGSNSKPSPAGGPPSQPSGCNAWVTSRDVMSLPVWINAKYSGINTHTSLRCSHATNSDIVMGMP